MRAIRITILAVAAVGALVSCSSDEVTSLPSGSTPIVTEASTVATAPPATEVAATTPPTEPAGSTPACTEVYFEGGPVTDAVTEGECIDTDGSTLIMGSALYDCVDGSTLGWNDKAWWDDTVHLYPADAETQTAPSEVLAACTG